MNYKSFFNEMVKIAGVGMDIHGYSSNPDKPSKKWLRSMKVDVNDPEEMDLMKYEYKREARIKTPHDRASSDGYKMHLYVLHGQSSDWKTLHKPSPFTSRLATDESYAKKTQVVNLSKPKIRALLKDYTARRQVGDKDEEAMQDAFVNKTKALLANPKLRFARVEYE